MWRKRYGQYDDTEALVELAVLDDNQFVLGMRMGNGLWSDVSQESNGIYFYQLDYSTLKDKYRRISSGKIIVQH